MADTTRILRPAAPPTAADLAAVEAVVGPLPAEYRAFLQRHNGGVPAQDTFQYKLAAGGKRTAQVRAFLPATDAGWIEPRHLPLLPHRQHRDGGGTTDLLVVGAVDTDVNSGDLVLVLRGDDAGAVLVRPHDTTTPQRYTVAASWDTFLAGLRRQFKADPWDDAIERGDLTTLRDWLTKHRKKWDHGGDRTSIERKAVQENRRDVLELLHAEFGFEPASTFEECLDYHRLDLARHFLPAAAPALRPKALNTAGPFFWHVPELVRGMLAAGADPGHLADDGTAPLHHAVRANAPEAVELLLAAGADPTAATDDKLTPALEAGKREFRAVEKRLTEAEAAWRAKQPAEPPLAPFDLCGVRFTVTGKPITLAEISATEAAWGIDFPPQYRWLLTQANGAILSPDRLPESLAPELYDYDDEEEGDDYEQPDVRVSLSPLRNADGEYRRREADDNGPSLEYPVEEAQSWYHDGSQMPRGFLPIGSLNEFGLDGVGFLLIGCRGPERGQLSAFDHGRTTLGFGLPELFRKLAAAAAEPLPPDVLLADAVAAGDLAAVRAACAAGGAERLTTRDGRKPSVLACETGFDAAVLVMLDHGLSGDEALTAALEYGRLALARQVFDRTPKPKKDARRALLHYPAVYADLALVRHMDARDGLIAAGLKDKYATPLTAAVLSGHVPGVELLLAAGGNVRHRERDSGMTLMHAAATITGTDPRPMIAFLQGHGLDVNQANQFGQTPLHLAVESGAEEAGRALIDVGADFFGTTVPPAPEISPKQQKQMQGMVAELMRMQAKVAAELSAEDAPDLDPDDPAAKPLLDVAAMAKGMEERTAGLLPQLQAGRAAGGPAPADLGRRNPSLQPVIDRLAAYARGRNPG